MCVLALAWKTHPHWQLVLAANRDEFHRRPAADAGPWSDAPVLGGRDLQAGGSWLACDGHGRLAAVTNVRDPAAPAGGPSRGALPGAFLQADQSPATFVERLQTHATAFAPFNLVVADRQQAVWLGNHPLQHRLLTPGIHGLSNAALDEPWPKTEKLRQAVANWCAAGIDALAPLWDALGDERQPPDSTLPDTGIGLTLERTLAPVFLRGPAYGTRASTVVLIDARGRGRLHERRFGPDGIPTGSSDWCFDGQGNVLPWPGK